MYENIAVFYDFLMGNRRDLEFFANLVKGRRKKILELGCGTGELLKHLSGHDITGIDISKEMLDIAKKKVPNARLIYGDISKFNLSERFDYIFCIYDTINHLLDIRNWEKVFQNASNHLNENGIFVFDMNTKKRLDVVACSGKIITEKNDKRIEMIVVKNGKYYEYRLSMKQGSNIKNETVKEAAFDMEEVEKILEKYFSFDVQYILTRDIDEKEMKKVIQKPVFICRKK